MTTFTTFIETLRRNGVSSIGLEFHPPQIVAATTADVTLFNFGASIELAGVKFVKVDFFEPQAPIEPSTPSTPPDGGRREDLKQMPVPAEPPKTPFQPTSDPEPTKPAPKAEAAEPKRAAAAAAPEPEREQPKKGNKAKAEPTTAVKVESGPDSKSEVKAEAEAVKPASTLPSKPADVYDVFVETVEQDDGTKAELKRSLIAKMSLDDMLRVNNDFQLGLDTDVAGVTESLRAELLTCFA